MAVPWRTFERPKVLDRLGGRPLVATVSALAAPSAAAVLVAPSWPAPVGPTAARRAVELPPAAAVARPVALP